jgi:hypothetical protein
MAATIYARSNRVGIDQAIYRIQNLISNNLTWLDAHIYGRIYRNQNADSLFIPESFETGKEYKEIFVNDKKAGIVGFYVKDTRQSAENIHIASLDIICTVDVLRIYGSTLREDEKALLEMQNILLSARSFGLTEINEVNTGNQSVFADFDKERIKFRDMQPFANFSFSCELQFNTNLCLTS